MRENALVPARHGHTARETAVTATPVMRIMEMIAKANDDHIDRQYAALTEPLPLCGQQGTAVSADGTPALIKKLEHNAPWLTPATEFIWNTLALQKLGSSRWLSLPPLLLVGPPGAGKTHFARLLGRAADVGSDVMSVGGVSDNRLLEGTARGYTHTHPSWPLMTINRHRVANPILVIDEIDKAGGSVANGRIHHTLLGMMESQTAKCFFDPCLMAPANLSAINWILTANTLHGIPEPLLSRVQVIGVEAPGVEHFGFLMQAHRRKIASRVSCDVAVLPQLGTLITHRLEQEFAAHRSVRRLQKDIEAATGKLARQPGLSRAN